MSSHTLESSAHRRKRVRFSADDSSEPSISDSSALAATSVAEESTDASNFDSDSESELSDTSEEPSSDSESEDEAEDAESDVDMHGDDDGDGVTNLRANRGKKPVMKIDEEELGPDVRTFLKNFMPQLKAANDELEVQRRAGTLDSKKIEMDEDEAGGQYIEMDLGLGVLEERDPNVDDSSTSESDDSDTENGKKEEDVLAKLMGHKGVGKVASVQEVRNTPGS